MKSTQKDNERELERLKYLRDVLRGLRARDDNASIRIEDASTGNWVLAEKDSSCILYRSILEALEISANELALKLERTQS